MEKWRSDLRAWRDTAGYSRQQLAGLSGVSADSIKSYEDGRRSPSRESLTALLNVLHTDRHLRNQILEQAGFAADSVAAGRERLDPQHSLEQAVAEISGLPWPAFVANELMAVVEANALAQSLWGVDLDYEFNTLVERNLLAVMTTPRIANCIANWDEAAGILASMVKGSFGEASTSPTGSVPYYAAVMEHLMAGDLTYVQRFLARWADATPRIMKWRFSYPIRWQHPLVGPLRFHATVNLVNHDDYLTINEWIPIDEESWNALHRLRDSGATSG